ncbi:MFS transporter [Litorivicinus sp.]|nr:MFS transporter [Litorivicinus sp.]
MLPITMTWSGFVHSYEGMLILRLSQVALLSAIITATMAYLTFGREVHELSRVLALYISATIFGGMAGCVVSNQLASYIEWEWVASMWAALLLLVMMTPWRRATPKPLNLIKPEAQLGKRAVTGRGNGLISPLIFYMFWAFTGYLNCLPFRINKVYPGSSMGLVEQSYLGHSIEILSAFTVVWLAKRLGGPIRVAMIDLM